MTLVKTNSCKCCLKDELIAECLQFAAASLNLSDRGEKTSSAVPGSVDDFKFYNTFLFCRLSIVKMLVTWIFS